MLTFDYCVRTLYGEAVLARISVLHRSIPPNSGISNRTQLHECALWATF